MKCLSMTQPWASLVVTGAKKYETRSWATKYRGPLLIHAAKGFPTGARLLAQRPPFSTVLASCNVTELVLGAIIGKVTLTDCLPTPSLSSVQFEYLDGTKLPPDEPELSFGDYSPGRWVFVLENPVRFEKPVPYKGHLGFFEVHL